ncbi:MAG: hypothetical protein HC945_00310 [Nitrosarchaeum sp.]|nr:hypothetical protein [Nitrosarchaeum sp.]
MNSETPVAEYLFESSWEVCNKVGGINTVIKSKAALMNEKYPHYVLVGPYFEQNARIELEAATPPDYLRKAFADVASRGVKCVFGKWLVKGEPFVVLVDASSLKATKDAIKYELWEQHRIDSLYAQWEFEEPMLWSWAVGMLLDSVEKSLLGKRIVFHAHEWLAGFGQLYLKARKSRIATVFTTHATMLGRSLAGSGYDLYGMLENMNPEEWAYRLHVQDKFTAERAMARSADVFTTVSEITGIEAEKLLGRHPEVLVLNGLEMARFPTFEETSIKHAQNREELREFLSYYFFPYYTFDMSHTLIFFIVGRYEFHNKGFDIFIDALGRLNQKLQEEGADRHIAVFFWVPMGSHGLKQEIIENKNFYNHIKEELERNSAKLLQRMIYELTRDESVKEIALSKEFLQELRRDMVHFKRGGNPPICTHHVESEHTDPIINSLLSRGLDNKPDDKVKVVVYPAYLDGSDALVNLPYYDALTGCHLGVFPSYYEPWGYTPLDSAASGVPAITTDLAGFGRFIQKKMPSEKKGIYVVQRYQRSYEESVQQLYEILRHYANLGHAERVQEKIAAKTLSGLADWKFFIRYYIEAHNLALERLG